MDEVADLQDDEEFEDQKNTKSLALKNKIAEIAELSPVETEKIKVVCISANPDNRGFDFWIQHKESYEKRSRIKDLENTTNNVLENTSTQLITKTGFDTVLRIMSKYIEEIQYQMTQITEEIIPEMEKNLKRNKDDFEKAKKQILDKQDCFAEDIRNYRSELKNELDACTFETIDNFIKKEIGIENEQITGKYIVEKITIIMKSYFKNSAKIISNLAEDYEETENNQNEFFTNLGKGAINALGKGMGTIGAMPIGTLKDGIKIGQGILNNIFNAGINFKPWGITKLAGNFSNIATGISGAIPYVGVAITVVTEIAEHIKQSENDKKFEKLTKDLHKLIEYYTDNIIKLALEDNCKEFLKQFAPQLEDLQKYLDNQQKIINEQQEKNEFFKKWKERAEDAEILES